MRPSCRAVVLARLGNHKDFYKTRMLERYTEKARRVIFFARAQVSIESIRKEIEGRTLLREKISTSVELPLAPETKHVLAYAHEESDRLQHRHIGTEHLLLGLLREERSMAAEILYERGLRLNAVRDEIARQSGADARSTQKKDTPHLVEVSRKELCAVTFLRSSNTNASCHSICR